MLVAMLLAALPPVPADALSALHPSGLSASTQPCLQFKSEAAEGNPSGEKARPVRPKAQPHKLGELPPGGLYLTVVRHVGHCQIPTLVRDGYGAVGSGQSGR
jgi:hypothetical protein